MADLASASSYASSPVLRRKAGMMLGVGVAAILLLCTRGRIEGGWTARSLREVGRSSIAKSEAAADSIAAVPGSIAETLRRNASTACELVGRSRSERVRNLRPQETARMPSTVGIGHVPGLHGELEKVPQSRGRWGGPMKSSMVGFRCRHVRLASIDLQFDQHCMLRRML